MNIQLLKLGAHNHKYFLGFLTSLLGLCIVILSASVQYWQFECWTNLTHGHTADNYLVAAATCDAWVMWVMTNTALHSFWVGTLLACQCYQVRRKKLISKKKKFSNHLNSEMENKFNSSFFFVSLASIQKKKNCFQFLKLDNDIGHDNERENKCRPLSSF